MGQSYFLAAPKKYLAVFIRRSIARFPFFCAISRQTLTVYCPTRHYFLKDDVLVNFVLRLFRELVHYFGYTKQYENLCYTIGEHMY